LFWTIRKSINSTVSMGSLISATAARGALEDMADLVRPSKYFHSDHRNGHYDNGDSKNSSSHRKSNNTSGPLATISVPSAGDVDDRIKHVAPQKEIYSSPVPTGRVDDFGLFHKTLTVDKLLSELMFAPNRVNDVCCLSKLMGVHSSYCSQGNPLHAACIHGRLDIVQALIDHDADINRQYDVSNFCWTSL
jgi:hypothetical protein